MSTSQAINGLQHYLPDTTDAEWGGILSSYLHGLSYSKRALLVFGASSGLAASVVSYGVPGYAATTADEPFIPAPFAGVIRAGLLRCRTAPSGGSVRGNVRLNGSDVTGAVIAVGATTASMTVNQAVAAGDRISFSIDPSSGYASGAADLFLSLALVAS